YQPPRFDPVANTSPAPMSIGGLEVTTVIDHALLARLAAGDPVDAPRHDPHAIRAPYELSMEDLIDLEQQVEFFVLLGQDEAALELLSAHVRDAGAVSPLPYFRLLEIHRRRGEESAYARVAEAFKRRFGAVAPAWETAGAEGRSLEDYPEAIVRLQNLWAMPVEAMRTIEAWLFRRQPADEIFDFGPYRELLFLYSIAREVSEESIGDGIDLLLPLGEQTVDLSLPGLGSPSQFGDRNPHARQLSTLDLDISGPAPFDGESKLRQAI
ncbi:MAG TPA: hypothetical protein VF319_12850, partial [Caldimonas sp.]